MQVYSCGFNEFGQVSSAANDEQHVSVTLPTVVDMQSKIGTKIAYSTLLVLVVLLLCVFIAFMFSLFSLLLY